MRGDKDNLIVNLTLAFAIKVIEFCEVLESKRKYVVANQPLRAGTSIGANTFEAQNAESRFDFIHKFKIAGKEADETQYWLTICQRSRNYPNPEGLQEDLMPIIKIISKIISSSKG
ncbi:MAG TPA: four helix bundle protein [Cyclobacteriaceae bacterium]|nr:four helix bundle protein [Cyclobacteriaceae bacterium]